MSSGVIVTKSISPIDVFVKFKSLDDTPDSNKPPSVVCSNSKLTLALVSLTSKIFSVVCGKLASNSAEVLWSRPPNGVTTKLALCSAEAKCKTYLKIYLFDLIQYVYV